MRWETQPGEGAVLLIGAGQDSSQTDTARAGGRESDFEVRFSPSCPRRVSLRTVNVLHQIAESLLSPGCASHRIPHSR